MTRQETKACGEFAEQENTVFVKRYPSGMENVEIFPVNLREIWRYAGFRQGGQEKETPLKQLLQEVLTEAAPLVEPQVCYRVLPLNRETMEQICPFIGQSRQLGRLLDGCSRVVLFAATIGMKFDRLLVRIQRLSPAKGLLLSSFGSERVEALCDGFCREMEEEVCGEGLELTPRFSPGYGDVPLQAQDDFFRLLDCSRQIGVSIGRQMLMTPEKSVTALFGIREKGCGGGRAGMALPREAAKCAGCRKQDCEFRIVRT